MHVADAREQVVLDLEIQAAEEPAQHAVAAGEVHRRLHLVNRPVVLEAVGLVVGTFRIFSSPCSAVELLRARGAVG